MESVTIGYRHSVWRFVLPFGRQPCFRNAWKKLQLRLGPKWYESAHVSFRDNTRQSGEIDALDKSQAAGIVAHSVSWANGLEFVEKSCIYHSRRFSARCVLQYRIFVEDSCCEFIWRVDVAFWFGCVFLSFLLVGCHPGGVGMLRRVLSNTPHN